MINTIARGVSVISIGVHVVVIRYLNVMCKPSCATMFSTQFMLKLLSLEYKLKRCSKKKCCKQCGQVKFMGTMTKWPVQKHTEHHKHGAYKDATYIKK